MLSRARNLVLGGASGEVLELKSPEVAVCMDKLGLRSAEHNGLMVNSVWGIIYPIRWNTVCGHTSILRK